MFRGSARTRLQPPGSIRREFGRSSQRATVPTPERPSMDSELISRADSIQQRILQLRDSL